jgi:hypothetical protein
MDESGRHNHAGAKIFGDKERPGGHFHARVVSRDDGEQRAWNHQLSFHEGAFGVEC